MALIPFDKATASLCALLHRGETGVLTLAPEGIVGSGGSGLFWEGNFTGTTSGGDLVSGYSRVYRQSPKGRFARTFPADVMRVGDSCELHSLKLKALIAAVD